LNDYLVSVLLGIVEGLTEFLPISSTAHLRVAEALLHLDLADPFWKMYTVVIQVGAILALCLLFMGRILEFVRTFPRGENGNKNILTHPISLTFFAFVATSIPSLLLIKKISKNMESVRAMAFAFLIGGIVMWIVDAWTIRHEAKTTDVEEMNLVQAIWIGLCQTLAPLFPGTSRSMATIVAGQIGGLTRQTALEFSFLLSIPTMIAATGYDLFKEVFHRGHSTGAEIIPPLVMTGERWAVLAIGVAVSFIVALGVVEWFLQWVRKHGLVLFAIYRIILAIVLLTWGQRIMAGN
jgi:undecaprenyl-diphosphatase